MTTNQIIVNANEKDVREVLASALAPEELSMFDIKEQDNRRIRSKPISAAKRSHS